MILEQPGFKSADSKRVYQHVERNGTVETASVRDALDMPASEFRSAVDELTEQEFLTEQNGTLALRLDIGAEREYEADDITYVVRPARDEDFEQLVDTIQEITDRRTYAVGEELADELRYEDTVTRHNSVWSRVFFVATVDGYVVGWSHLDLPHSDKLRETARLTVGVRKEYRGYGVGKRLLDRALSWAETNGYRKVYNSVARTNMNAVTFLERQGWHREAVRENHFTIDGEPVDEVMLAYTF
jgi:ribosomal protein S18 acetylase RimI-like enzyme